MKTRGGFRGAFLFAVPEAAWFQYAPPRRSPSRPYTCAQKFCGASEVEAAVSVLSIGGAGTLFRINVSSDWTRGPTNAPVRIEMNSSPRFLAHCEQLHVFVQYGQRKLRLNWSKVMSGYLVCQNGVKRRESRTKGKHDEPSLDTPLAKPLTTGSTVIDIVRTLHLEATGCISAMVAKCFLHLVRNVIHLIGCSLRRFPWTFEGFFFRPGGSGWTSNRWYER